MADKAEKPDKVVENDEDQSSEDQQASAQQKKVLKIVLIVIGALAAVGIIIAILFAVFVGTVTKKVVDTASDATGTHVSKDGKEVTVETDQGKTTVKESKSLPDEFPSGFPIYKPSKITSSSKSSYSTIEHWSVTLESDSSPDEVYEYYKQQLDQGDWEVNASYSSQNGSSVSSRNESNDLSATVAISEAKSDSDKNTKIVIGINKKDSSEE